MLFEFITLNREEIIARCRAKVAARSIPPPSEAEINHGVPLFLDQLVAMMRSGGTSNDTCHSSAALCIIEPVNETKSPIQSSRKLRC